MDRFAGRRPYVLLFLGILALMIAVFGAVAVNRHRNHPATPPAPTLPAASGTWAPSQPPIPDDVHVSWAYVDSTEGSIATGGDLDQHPLDQLVVPGLAQDRLNTIEQRGQSVSPRDTAILHGALTGDRPAADQLAADAGGADTAMTRVIDACQLDDTTAGPAQATVLDTARYAACLREGAITDPDTAAWVLGEMRNNRGGIGDVRGRDGRGVAQFNSTAPAGDGRMRTGCLAVGAYWSGAVFVDWPADRGEVYGVAACAAVADASFPPDTQQAPDSPAPADEAHRSWTSRTPSSGRASASAARQAPSWSRC